VTARRVRQVDRKPGRSTPAAPKRPRAQTPEEIAQAATAHDIPAGPSGDKVKVSLTLSLSRAQVKHLTARAFREGKNLEALAGELLEAVPPGRGIEREEERR